jgi:hypothetical protein
MNRSDMAWQRLIKAARQVPREPGAVAPHGFATRAVAHAFAAKRPAPSLFEQFALRAVGVACLLAVLGVVSNYTMLAQSVPTHVADSFVTLDPASIVLGEADYE